MDISHVPLGRSLMDELNNKVFSSGSSVLSTWNRRPWNFRCFPLASAFKENKKPRLRAAAGASLSPRRHLNARGWEKKKSVIAGIWTFHTFTSTASALEMQRFHCWVGFCRFVLKTTSDWAKQEVRNTSVRAETGCRFRPITFQIRTRVFHIRGI